MTTIFQGEDLIFYKGINGNIMSGGYDVESHMLRNGISPMKTLNLEQNGGIKTTDKKESRVSNEFENLAVPAGLYYITQPQSKPKNMAQHSYDKEHTPLSDDIFDKLYEMIEYNDKKKRKTKKQNLSVDKKHKKTKKQSFL
jgi:hypothetical protein